MLRKELLRERFFVETYIGIVSFLYLVFRSMEFSFKLI